MNPEPFFAYARKRYQVLLNRRSGLPAPWTADPILQQYRFCNIFREDDTTTQWIRERLTHRSYGYQVLQAMIIARWFNRIETLERFLPSSFGDTPYFPHNLLFNWDGDKVRERLADVRPLVTGAYMIKTPAGMSKLEGLIQCIERVIEAQPHEYYAEALVTQRSIQEVTEWLQQFPFIGPFMAYEVATDMRHTPMLRSAPDIMTWANPGPGANRGCSLVAYGHPDQFKSWSKADREEMLEIMRDLLALSQKPTLWPAEWPRWEMREVEHTLCELMKYTKAQEGKRLKQKYDGQSKETT